MKLNEYSKENIIEARRVLGYTDEVITLLVNEYSTTFWKWMLWGPILSRIREQKNYSLSFEPNGILLIEVDYGTIEMDKNYFISNEMIADMEFKKGVLGGMLIVTDVNGNKKKFKFVKMLGSDWQNYNIIQLKNKFNK